MNTVLLESRPYRPFKSSEEYLYAMREDLAEWMNTLYPELRINVDNFMDRLDTGVALCKVGFEFFWAYYLKCFCALISESINHTLMVVQCSCVANFINNSQVAAHLKCPQ